MIYKLIAAAALALYVYVTGADAHRVALLICLFLVVYLAGFISASQNDNTDEGDGNDEDHY